VPDASIEYLPDWEYRTMRNATTARETLDLLWSNYVTLAKQVDVEAMDAATVEEIPDQAPRRPFRIAAWLGRQGCFIAAWSLWEYYARSLCQGLPKKEKKAKDQSTADWICKSLTANGIHVRNQAWFSSANSLRNLIAHFGARAEDTRAKSLLERSHTAFPDLSTWKDGYLDIRHSHVADLGINIRRFIRDTTPQGDPGH
jgi:hypothetical protein